jgi:hypothetical protein
VPLIPFDTLPDDARLWVFAARAPLDEVDEKRLLTAVDSFPLTCAREFRDEHFLAIAVDERASDASGCSIDGLFRVLKGIEEGIGTTMIGGGMVYFRAGGGMVLTCTQHQFELMSLEGAVNGDTIVFDTTLTTLGEYRTRFEPRARDSWAASLLVQARK